MCKIQEAIEIYMEEMIFFKRFGAYSLFIEDMPNPGCSNGQYPGYELRDDLGNVVASGRTCRCHRGCASTEDVSRFYRVIPEHWDEWGGATLGGNADAYIVSAGEIEHLANNWGVGVDDLLKQVEEI